MAIKVKQFYSHGNIILSETKKSMNVVFIKSEAANFENTVWSETSISILF